MPDWPLFAGAIVVLTIGFVLLARASARAVAAALDVNGHHTEPTPSIADRLSSTRAVAGNVLASHGLLVVLIVVVVWYADVPTTALGATPIGPEMVALGGSLGLVLAVANVASASALARIGINHDERLRELLAPETPLGWIGLLLVVLPVVALAEELLFRGALVGGLSTGFGLSIWGLALVSSVLFGLGHGLQGSGGVLVATGLGAILAAAFVITGSLTVVVVAHYVVNAAEFAVKEGPGPVRSRR